MSTFSISVPEDMASVIHEVPIISDKLLIDLVNGIQVNKELIDFRAKQGFLSKLLDTVFGNSDTRQNLIDANFTAISESIKEYIYRILHDLTISNTAIAITQKKLIETRDTLRSHQREIDSLNDLYSELNSRLNAYEQRVKNLESQVYRLEVIQNIDRIITAWESKRTYQRFHPILQLVFLIFELCDFCIIQYECKTGSVELRQYSIDRLVKSSDFLPDFPVSVIDIYNTLNVKQNKDAEFQYQLAYSLLEVRSSPINRYAKQPYLFMLGTTLELNQILPSPAKTAFEIYKRNLSDKFFLTVDRRQFIETMFREVIDDRMYLINGGMG